MPTSQLVVKQYQRFPIVVCPGCKTAMALKETRPLLFTADLYTAAFHCEQCGVDSKREFKRARA